MNIVILGAGVAGVAAAIALTERGHAVRVFERRAHVTTLGAGLTLWPNATFVLDELGVLPAIAAVGGRPNVMARFDADACRRRDEAARATSGAELGMASLWSRALPVGGRDVLAR